jgi:DNA-binding NarL/FixJ family response regulator
MKHTIAIVDDHVLIAQALKGIISGFENFDVLFECENGKELVNKLKDTKNIPDIVLLDISMPEMNGYETALWLNSNHPEVK